MVPADRFCFPTGQTGLYGRGRNFRLSAAAKDAAEKSENAVIPSAARDPSWFKCPQRVESVSSAWADSSEWHRFRLFPQPL